MNVKFKFEIGQSVVGITQNNITFKRPCTVCHGVGSIRIEYNSKPYNIHCPECSGSGRDEVNIIEVPVYEYTPYASYVDMIMIDKDHRSYKLTYGSKFNEEMLVPSDKATRQYLSKLNGHLNPALEKIRTENPIYSQVGAYAGRYPVPLYITCTLLRNS